jgi:hypothetical protein
MEVVDTAEIIVLVDNASDSLSSTPDSVETEFARHRRRGMPWLSGKCLCCAAHGLSCLITVTAGATRQTLLFDTGPEEWVFERNVQRLGVDLCAGWRPRAVTWALGPWWCDAAGIADDRHGERRSACTDLHASRHVRAPRYPLRRRPVSAHGVGSERSCPKRLRGACNCDP